LAIELPEETPLVQEPYADHLKSRRVMEGLGWLIVHIRDGPGYRMHTPTLKIILLVAEKVTK